jgi:hypothetical protein
MPLTYVLIPVLLVVGGNTFESFQFLTLAASMCLALRANLRTRGHDGGIDLFKGLRANTNIAAIGVIHRGN